MTAESSGICRNDGVAVFVPRTAVGDKCVVRVVKVLKNYAFGRLEQLLVPSADRCEPDCPVSAQCGGCVYRHISYESELQIKTQRVRDALERIGGFRGIAMEPILAAPHRNFYRNKCQLPIGLSKNGELQLGFYAVNSHRIVDTHTCLLQPEEFDKAAEVSVLICIHGGLCSVGGCILERRCLWVDIRATGGAQDGSQCQAGKCVPASCVDLHDGSPRKNKVR